MPFRAARATTLRQERWQSLIALRKNGSSSRFDQLRVLVEGFLDLAQEHAADDAAAAPHQGDAAVVEVPVVFLGRGAHEHVALRVGDDLRRIERLPDVLDELLRGRR